MRNSKGGLANKVAGGILIGVLSLYTAGCDIVNYIINHPDVIPPGIEYHGPDPVRRVVDEPNPNLRPYISVFDNRDGKITDYTITFPNFDSDRDGNEEPSVKQIRVRAEDSSGNSNSRNIEMEVYN